MEKRLMMRNKQVVSFIDQVLLHPLLLFALLVLIQETRSSCNTLNYCSGHGRCGPSSKCVCEEGWGAEKDVAIYKAPDCSMRTCPSGRSWADVPQGELDAHRIAECSDMGVCNRITGQCKCVKEFSGKACDRQKCPNDCSGHGACKSMRQLALTYDAQPLGVNVRYGQLNTTYDIRQWDADKIFACVCDSSWPVGLGAGERQEPEWFGPDCSLRHCPSGDNPRTGRDDTNCQGVTISNNYTQHKGQEGNLCHVDCSNQGICDHTLGLCRCFMGFYGSACEVEAARATPSRLEDLGLLATAETGFEGISALDGFEDDPFVELQGVASNGEVVGALPAI